MNDKLTQRIVFDVYMNPKERIKRLEKISMSSIDRLFSKIDRELAARTRNKNSLHRNTHTHKCGGTFGTKTESQV